MARRVDEEKIKHAWRLSRRRYSQDKIAACLDHNKRTVQNWLNRRWLAERSLSHLATADLAPIPAEMCALGDHSWLEEERFEGLVYRRQDANKLIGNHVIVQHWRVCAFCDHRELFQV